MYVLTIEPGGHRVPVTPGDTIDAALARAGYVRPRRGCRRGGCGKCMLQVDRGTTRDERPIADTVLSSTQRADGLVLPCRAMPTSDVEVTLLDGEVRCISPIQRALAERRLADVLPQPTGGS